MPKSGVDGPSYAGHVNVNPHGSEPEWVLEQDAPAQAVEVAAVVEAKPEIEDVKPRRAAKRGRS